MGMAGEMGYNTSQLPLAGVILCCTSIPPERRSDLASVASQMGAVHKLDLTSDVTHLIVGDTDTPKYKYVAKERPDVKCLSPNWIEAVRLSWIEGGETDVEALELQYGLPTFMGLKVCVTGFEDLVYRKKLEDYINDNGGEYNGDLTKKITHLIANKPAGNKYNYAGQWGIKIVSTEWVMQSLERGMILDESLYHPLLPTSERGRNAWVRRPVARSPLGKRPRDTEIGLNVSRKLRRTASAKLSSQNSGLWTDIVGGAFGTGAEEVGMNQWDDQQGGLGHSIAESKDPKSDKHMSKGEISGRPNARIDNALKSEATFISRPSHKDALFQGKRFYIHGFDAKKTTILQDHLRSHDADVIAGLDQWSESPTPATPEDEGSYLLIPHTTPRHAIPRTPDAIPQPTLVTDLWIERCLHHKHFVQPQANITNTPFRRFPIAGFETMTICSTGFQGVDLLHMYRAVKLMGATYDEYLNPDASALLCNTPVPNRSKLRQAQEWNIPAVSADWLWDCIRAGQHMNFDAYITTPNHRTEQALEMAKPSISSKEIRRRGESPQDPKRQAVSACNTVKERLELHTKLQEPSKSNSLQQPSNSTGSKVHRSTPSLTVEISNDHDDEDTEDTQRFDEDTRPTDTKGTEDTLKSADEILDPESLGPDSSHTLRARSAPLTEISLNPSPKPSPSPVKSIASQESVKSPRAEQQNSLCTAINSLLAHHQRGVSNAPANATEIPRLGRRKRHLLGRAPSNLSTRSNGSANFSRASSVDTLNTDGLGTPIEPSISNARKASTEKITVLRNTEDQDTEEEAGQKLQMTQLGYEDPEVKVWREKVVKKIGGGKEVVSSKMDGGGRVKGIGTVTDVVGRGAHGAGRRTRRSGGR